MPAARNPRLCAVMALCSPASPAGGPSNDATTSGLSAADALQSESTTSVSTTQPR
jgi:hypothetical protein